MKAVKTSEQPSSALFAVPSGALSYRFFLSFSLLILAGFSLWLQQARISIFILALINVVFCADIFLRVAYKDLCKGKITWALWVSWAVLSGVTYSGLNTLTRIPWLRPIPDLFLYTILITLLALWGAKRLVLEQERAHVFTRKIDDFLPKAGRLLEDGRARAIFSGEIVKGDVLLVKAGERFPADGVICTGTTCVDEQLITGNILPAAKEAGSQVYAGTLNKAAGVEIEVTEPLRTSAVMSVLDAIKNAELAHREQHSTLDVFSKYAFCAVFLVGWGCYGLMTFSIRTDWVFYLGALLCAWTILCSFGLVFSEVFPAVFMCKGAEKIGVLIQNIHALERVAKTDVVFFDKTGTLTYGRLRVSGLFPTKKNGGPQLLEAVCAAEQSVDGPFAQAVKRLAYRKAVKEKDLQESNVFPGLGVEVLYDKKRVHAGSIPWFKELGIALPAEVEQTQQAVICVAMNKEFLGYLTLADDLREGAAETIDFLKQQGKEIMLVSGDTEKSVSAVAEKVGIEKINYFVLPKTKAEIITNLRSLGKKVIMVGDGFNDIIALLKADAGVVFFSGSNVYNNWVDLVLKTEELSPLQVLFALYRKYRRIVWQNMGLALVVNLVFVWNLLAGTGTSLNTWYGTLGVGVLAVVLVWLNAMRMLNINDEEN